MIFREAVSEDFDIMPKSDLVELVDYVYTLEDDGKPIMVGGFRRINQTTAWCWVELGDVTSIITVYRTIKEWVDKFCDIHKVKRLQAFTRIDDKAIRMVEHLGFTRESTMINFFGDEDAYMYVRII